jgi:hypothetical protein
MPKAGQDGERPGAWFAFRENWPAIFGATALGMAVALLGRWWLSGPKPPGTDEMVVQAADSSAETAPPAVASRATPPAGVVEPSATSTETLATSASGRHCAPAPTDTREPVRVVSVEPQENAAPSGAWLTGRIEEVADEPPLANAARLLDDLPVRR